MSILINIGLLIYFKYANFFIENVQTILKSFNIESFSWVNVALPIGISFFTFQSLTYTIDVYRKVHAPLQKLSDYLLYILMFPQLIAGPIVRFNTIADDILDRKKNETSEKRLYGIYRFTIGLAKKILIANVLGEQVDAIYALPNIEINTMLSWVAIIAYSFQIYFDFSGYSDMAIGLGKLMGFNFPENFNNPYASQSITEFWRRWHITLGEWMKDYLYIPLGGNRVNSKNRLYLNLLIVFFLSGLWHGASWNFVIWGLWHGIFLIFDRLFLVKTLSKIGKYPRVIFNYIVVLVGWVFFRIEEFSQSLFYIRTMFICKKTDNEFPTSSQFWVTLIFAALVSFITLSKIGLKTEQIVYYKKLNKYQHIIFFLISILMLALSVSYLSGSGFNPFIYFRF
ncbi:MAG: MBOAT family protein [Salinivirgaceae bacterium]|nr:MBOAT family protein [Salinivirgaceae bacterium]